MPQAWDSIYTAIARMKNWSYAVEGPKRNFKLNLDPTPHQLHEYIQSTDGPAIVDFETPRDNHDVITISGVSVAQDSAYSFPWKGEYIDVMADLLGDPTRWKGGHNFAFDQHAARKYQVKAVWPVFDTIQAEALLRPPFREARKRRWYTLAQSTQRLHNGTPHWKDPDNPSTAALYRVMCPDVPDWQHARLYNALDCLYNFWLWCYQRAQLEQMGMLDLFVNIVAPAGMVLVDIEERGLPLDEPLRLKLRVKTEKLIESHTVNIRRFAAEAHTHRRSLLLGAIQELENAVAEHKRTHPDTVEPGSRVICRLVCDRHPTYTGYTKRSKCAVCAEVFAANLSQRSLVKEIGTRRTKARTRLKQIGEEFKPDNDNHWRWLLFDPDGPLALTPLETTDKKKLPKVDEDNIEALQRLHPDVEVLRLRVELQHALHRLRFVLSVPTDDRGRVHFAFSLHRTENGRVASGLDEEEPEKARASAGGNAQNITEFDRQIYISEPGSILGEHDLKQVELDVMARLARDLPLIKVLTEGGDIHSENASAIFSTPIERVKTDLVWFEGGWRTKRHCSKRGSHGWDYGMMDYKCGRMFQPWANNTRTEVAQFLSEKFEATSGHRGISLIAMKRRVKHAEDSMNPRDEVIKAWARLYDAANTITAEGWRLAYFGKWKGLARYQDFILDLVKRQRVLRNPFARMLRFYGFKWNRNKKVMEFTEREEALAFTPASTVGDMVKWMLPRVNAIASKHGGELLTTTHDSFLSMLPDKPAVVAAYHADMKVVLEREWPEMDNGPGILIAMPGKFRCRTDFTTGYNWRKGHVCTTECKADCVLVNPRGQFDYTEQAA